MIVASGLQEVSSPAKMGDGEPRRDSRVLLEEEKVKKTKNVNVRDIDVICGRGRIPYNHVGNRIFRGIVAEHIESYCNCIFASQRSIIVQSVIEKIQSLGGRFLTKDHNKEKWLEMSSKQSRDKVAHAMRDAAKPILDAQKQQTSIADPFRAHYHSTESSSIEYSANDSFFDRLHPQISMQPLNTCNTVLDYFNIPIAFPPPSTLKIEATEVPQSVSITHTMIDCNSSNFSIGSNEKILANRLSPERRNLEVAKDKKPNSNHKFNAVDEVTRFIQLIQTDKYPIACENEIVKTSILTPSEDLGCSDLGTLWLINDSAANDDADLEEKPNNSKISTTRCSPVDAIEDSFVKAIDDALGPLDKDEFNL